MKKYKLLLIIFIGTILASLIYFTVKDDSINYLALGDGLSCGMTPYHVAGYDYNDFLVEELSHDGNFKTYYKDFNEVDETIKSLQNKINSNEKNVSNKITINQAIEKSSIITIALGMDELNNYASKNMLTNSKINKFIENYGILIDSIKRIADGKIYIIGLYESNLIKTSKIELINQKLKELCISKSIQFVDISNIVQHKEYFNIKSNYYPNYKGHDFIHNEIKRKIEVKVMEVV